jgi:hypothetical protein
LLREFYKRNSEASRDQHLKLWEQRSGQRLSMKGISTYIYIFFFFPFSLALWAIKCWELNYCFPLTLRAIKCWELNHCFPLTLW